MTKVFLESVGSRDQWYVHGIPNRRFIFSVVRVFFSKRFDLLGKRWSTRNERL